MPSLRMIRRTFTRDIKAVRLYALFLFFLKKCHLLNQSVADLFTNTAKKYGNKVCFIYEDQEWTFRDVDEFSNKVANCFLMNGYKKGDEVALIMENCPEFICFWLGMAKIGVVTALINTNVREDALGHSINILDAKAVIFGKNMSHGILRQSSKLCEYVTVNDRRPETFTGAYQQLHSHFALEGAIPFINKRETIEYYYYSEKGKIDTTTFPAAKSLNTLLDDASSAHIDLGDKKPGFTDKLLYIYTSGTTGLPKAAIIRNSRFLWMCVAARYMVQIPGFEIFYNPLPLYHSSGGIIFVGYILVFGSTMVIRKKFSASNFWKDCIKYKVTATQYIGEICRYLLNQPKTPEETQHSVKVLMGNGLKPHIWTEFQDRFKIERIVEFYGSTEGNANLINIFGKVGKVGFVSRVADRVYPIYLMKVNPETGDILRDENGLCIRCKPGEPGELVARIRRGTPLNSFDGYANPNDTKKKIARNCFRHGDTAFLSGDILVMDEDGYFSFMDRTGDTFRWKGENVSTGEVENIVSKALSHAAVVVYGVEVPNVEGRAGMAAIQMNGNDLNFSNLYENIIKKLPSYAIPFFIRVTDIDTTGTYKLRKVTLQKQGFNPEDISDPLFFVNHKQKTYVPLTKELYSEIATGVVKL